MKKESIRKSIIIICIAITCIIIGIIIMFNSLNSKTTTEKTTNSKELSSEKYYEYYSNVQLTIEYFNLFLYQEYPVRNINTLSSRKKTAFLLQLSMPDYKTKEVTVKQLNEKLKDYFLDFKLYDKNIVNDDNEVLYEYDNSSKKYTSLISESNFCSLQTKEVSDVGYINSWISKRKAYYTRLGFDGSSYSAKIYSSLNDCEKEKNEVLNIESNYTTLSDSDYEKIKGSLKTYRYNFIKDNDVYKLESVTFK